MNCPKLYPIVFFFYKDDKEVSHFERNVRKVPGSTDSLLKGNFLFYYKVPHTSKPIPKILWVNQKKDTFFFGILICFYFSL